MRLITLCRDGFSVGLLLSLIAGATPAFAATSLDTTQPVVAQAAASSATLTGSVRDSTGAAVAGARVNVSGATSQSTTTDANGAFTLAVPAGLYRISIERAGYNPVSLADFTAVAGTSTPVNVTMTQASLNSLRTIGTVTSTTRGNTINAGPATQTFLPAQAFANLPSPQINSVIEHAPDVTLQHMGSQPDTTIVVGAVQPYETQVLIDGHPLALGQTGTWSSQYFPSYLIGGLETQTGPGNTTPFANLAVGGTANILTPAFTKRTTAELVYGVDNFASQYTNFLATGSFGNLEYVVALGSAGQNTPFTGTNKCITKADKNNLATIVDCIPADGNFFNKGEAFKLNYAFTPTTSLELGFVGAWGGYNPQGTAWGSFYGQQQIEACQTTDPNNCTNPRFNYLIGKNVNGYTWYTGSAVYNNQNLYDAQFRQSFGTTTLLVRPYIADIAPEEISQTPGAGQNSYTSFYGPVGSGSYPNGTFFATPPAPSNGAETECAKNFGNLLSPNNTYTNINGQFGCYAGPYTTYEIDKLYGMTTSIIQPIGGDSVLNFTYDFHGQSTFAYINSPASVSVPFSADRFTTFSLTGDLHFIPKVGINFGVYDTTWTVSGSTPELDATGNPVLDKNGNEILQALGRSVTKLDPHLAFVFRPSPNLAIRAASGGSTTFPFVGQVSGLSAYQQPAISLGIPFAGGGTLIEKNPNLNPETSWAYSLGADLRFKNNSILSLDGTQTTVHGVFEQLTSIVPRPDLTPYLPAGPVALEGVFFPINAAKLDSRSIVLKYNYAPPVGFGFNLAAAANRVIISGLTPNLYAPGAASLPANDVQVCGNGTTAPGITTCIPYLQGYGQFTYAFKDGAFLGLGTQYFGKNNSYFSPPFAQVDLVARKPVNKYLEFQLSVQNLLNTNNYGAYLAIPGAGTPLVAGTTNASFSEVSQTTYPPTALISAPPRTFRLQLRIHSGR